MTLQLALDFDTPAPAQPAPDTLRVAYSLHDGSPVSVAPPPTFAWHVEHIATALHGAVLGWKAIPGQNDFLKVLRGSGTPIDHWLHPLRWERVRGVDVRKVV